MSLLARVPLHSRISSHSAGSSPQIAAAALAAAALAALTGLAACSAKLAARDSAAPRAAEAEAEPGAASGAANEAANDRPGLGTSWGESVRSPVHFSPFERASAPWAELALHYNDADGVMAHARYLGARPAPLEVRAGDGAVSVALVDDDGRTLPGFSAGGRTLIAGEDGARYRIVVRNATDARFEVVASVDGLDVIDGHPADPNRRGYLIDPHGALTIDGFRTSSDDVAAFRFGRVADSYAAQSDQAFGDRNVGVIGLAIFAERGAEWNRREISRRDTADPFPERGFAAPPR